MNSAIIKLKYGYTIDKNNPCDEPCPRCGRVVCHVKEDPYKVFCANTFCDFQDTINPNWNKPILDRFRYFLNYPPLYLTRNDYQYSQYKCPFISEEDIKAGRFIVRDFKLDSEKYNNEYFRRAGLEKKYCYRVDSPIIARYGSLELMVNDGWLWEENPTID